MTQQRARDLDHKLIMELKWNNNIDYIISTENIEEEELVLLAARFQSGMIDAKGNRINFINLNKGESVRQYNK